MSVWGPLQERFETAQPRKILALDGGGIRGVLTLEILAEMEKQLRGKLNKGDDFVLGRLFRLHRWHKYRRYYSGRIVLRFFSTKSCLTFTSRKA